MPQDHTACRRWRRELMKRIHMSTPISVLALALFDLVRWGVCPATRVAQISRFLPPELSELCPEGWLGGPASLAWFYISLVGVAQCNLLHFWISLGFKLISRPYKYLHLRPGRDANSPTICPQLLASRLCLGPNICLFGQQFNAQSMFDQRKLSFN